MQKMSKKLIAIVVGLILLLGVFYFAARDSANKTPTSNGKVSVVTSFYPLYFFTTKIGGDKVSVSNITPAGAEPHDYEPTTQDVARIENAQLLVLNGGVEAWGSKIKDNLKGTSTEIIVAGDGLLTQKLTEEGTTTLDPHIWLAPPLAKQEVHKIAQALEKVDPKNADYYLANEKRLDGEFDKLDNEFKTGLASCKKPDIITSHAAFGYLAKEYGLRQVPITGISPDAEPSSAQLAQVTKFAKANNVKYIFFESLVSPKLSDTIASEVGAKTLVLDPLEGLSNDDLKAGKNYFSVMRENLTNLQTALECTK